MFQGNGVFLDQGQAVIPDGSIAQKMQAGNFGPLPYQSAPPGFVMPEVRPQMAQALAQPEEPPQQAPPGGDQLMMRLLALQGQAQNHPGSVGGNLDLTALQALGNPMDPAHFKNTMATQNAMAEALANRFGP